MKRSLFAGAALLAAVMLPASANAQDTIKIGVINPYSGQFADTAAQIDNGIKLYMKQHGDSAAGKKIEIIRKDTGGPNPDVAKRLAAGKRNRVAEQRCAFELRQPARQLLDQRQDLRRGDVVEIDQLIEVLGREAGRGAVEEIGIVDQDPRLLRSGGPRPQAAWR